MDPSTKKQEKTSQEKDPMEKCQVLIKKQRRMSGSQEGKSDSLKSLQGAVINNVRDESEDDSTPLDVIDFTRKCSWTDITLVVEGKELYVPKSHLAMLSPVFRLKFKSDFKEKDLDMIPLPGKKYEDVLTLLKCTHPGALKKVTMDVVPKVLPLAHEYQMKWLVDVCAELMSAHALLDGFDIVPACNIALLAEKYELKSVIETCIDRFSGLWHGLYKNVPEFNKLSLENRYKIVCRRLDSKDKREFK